MESVRVDRWLWSVRLFRSRSAATAACHGGHVRVNGARVKPAAPVKVGDTVEARAGDRDRVLEVVRLIDTRVGAPAAAECLIDRSPPPPPRESWPRFAERGRGAGRPSKQDRRRIEHLRGHGPR
jgi:ribosome-associated heat shock protein Hsp15